MTSKTIVGADCYMRYTDDEGKSWVTQHRVIAGGNFVEQTVAACEKQKIKAEQISAEDYAKERSQ